MEPYEACLRVCEQRNMTLSEACRRAGVIYRTVQRWKDGEQHVPHVRNVKMLAGVLGVKPVSILQPDIDYSGKYYTVDGVPVLNPVKKLSIVMCNAGMSPSDFASECHLDFRLIYRWIEGNVAISVGNAEKISRVAQVPMYVFLDDREPLRTGTYTQAEVDACAKEHIVYSIRAMYGISGKTKNGFCLETGMNNRTLGRLLAGMPPQANILNATAHKFGVGVKHLVTDYTKSDHVHEAFCSMSTLERMNFMMTLKGVTPAYLVDTLCWPSTAIFSGKPGTMPREVPYILAQYFKCPNAWFTRDTISLEPGQTLRTQWNTII